MRKYLVLLSLASILLVLCKKKDESISNSIGGKKLLQSYVSSKCLLPAKSLSLASEEKVPKPVLKDFQISSSYPYQLSILSDSFYDVAMITYSMAAKNPKSDYTLGRSFTLLADSPGLYTVNVQICDGSQCSDSKTKQFTSSYTASADEKAVYAQVESVRSELLKLAEKRVKLENLDADYKYVFLRAFNEVFIKHPNKLALAETICGPIAEPQISVTVPQVKPQDPNVVTITKTITETSTNLSGTATQVDTAANEDIKATIKEEFQKVSKYFGASISVIAAGFLGKELYDMHQMKVEIRLKTEMYDAIENILDEVKNQADYSSAYVKFDAIRGKYASVFDIEISQWLDEVKLTQEKLSVLKEAKAAYERTKDMNQIKTLTRDLTFEEANLKQKLAKFNQLKESMQRINQKAIDSITGKAAKYGIVMMTGGIFSASSLLLVDHDATELIEIDKLIYLRLIYLQSQI